MSNDVEWLKNALAAARVEIEEAKTEANEKVTRMRVEFDAKTRQLEARAQRAEESASNTHKSLMDAYADIDKWRTKYEDFVAANQHKIDDYDARMVRTLLLNHEPACSTMVPLLILYP